MPEPITPQPARLEDWLAESDRIVRLGPDGPDAASLLETLESLAAAVRAAITAGPSPSDVIYDDMTRAWRNGDYPLAWSLADTLLQYLADGSEPLTGDRDLYYVRQISACYAPEPAAVRLTPDGWVTIRNGIASDCPFFTAAAALQSLADAIQDDRPACAACGQALERVDVNCPGKYVHAGDEPADRHVPVLPAGHPFGPQPPLGTSTSPNIHEGEIGGGYPCL